MTGTCFRCGHHGPMTNPIICPACTTALGEEKRTT